MNTDIDIQHVLDMQSKIQNDNFQLFLFLNIIIGIIFCLMLISKKINIVRFNAVTIKFVFFVWVASIIYNYVVICDGLGVL